MVISMSITTTISQGVVLRMATRPTPGMSCEPTPDKMCGSERQIKLGGLMLGSLVLLSSAQRLPAPPCSYSLSPASASSGSAGGPGSLTVTVGSNCTWTASTTNAWLHTTNSGTGSGTVNSTA